MTISDFSPKQGWPGTIIEITGIAVEHQKGQLEHSLSLVWATMIGLLLLEWVAFTVVYWSVASAA